MSGRLGPSISLARLLSLSLLPLLCSCAGLWKDEDLIRKDLEREIQLGTRRSAVEVYMQERSYERRSSDSREESLCARDDHLLADRFWLGEYGWFIRTDVLAIFCFSPDGRLEEVHVYKERDSL